MSIVQPTRVLLVDNDDDTRDWLAEWLRREHQFVVDTARTGEEALELFQREKGGYDATVMDVYLEHAPDGVETMKLILHDWPEAQVLLMTAYGKVDEGVRALQAGACQYVFKQGPRNELVIHIRSAAEKRQLKRERDWLRILADVSEALSRSALDVNELAQAIYEQTTKLIPRSEVFYLALYDNATSNLRFVLAMEQGEKIDTRPRTLSDDPGTWGLTGWVIRKGLPLLINDLTQEPLPCPSFTFGKEGREARSYLGLPMTVGKRTVGVISVQCYDPHAITVDDQRFLEAVASQAGIALANAVAHQEQRAAQELTRSLLDNAPDGIMAVDSRGYAKLFSAGAERILGYTQAEVIGGSVHASRIWGGADKAKDFNDRLAQQRRIENETVQIHAKDGRPLSLLLSATLLDEPGPDGIRSIGFFKNIVALQVLQDELSARLEAVERVSAAQDMEEGLRRLAEALLHAEDATVCSVLRRDAETGHWSVRATHTSAGPSAGGSQDISSPFMDGMATWSEPRWYGRDDEEEGCNIVQHVQRQLQVGMPLEDLIVLPLRSGRETFGLCIIAFGPGQEERRRDNLLRLAGTIAAPAARMIERIGQQEATESRLDYALRLRGAVQAVSECTTASPQEVTEAVARAACGIIGADCAVLYLYHANPLAFDVRNVGAYGLLKPTKELSTKQREPHPGLATTVLQHAKALIVDDVDTDWDREHTVAIHARDSQFLQREGVKAFAGFPLIGGEAALGVLIVSFRSAHHFSQDELYGIEVLVEQATVSLGQARLSLRARKDRRISATSREITAQLGATATTHPVWRSMLKGALEVTGARRGAILLTDPADGRLKAATQRGFDKVRRRHLEALASGECAPLANCVRTGQAGLIDDLREDARTRDCCSTCLAARSLLVAAIGRHAQAPGVGVIVVESDERAAFSDDDKELLQGLGEYGAVALESAKRYASARRDAQVRAGLLQTGPDIAALKPLNQALQSIADTMRDILECDVVMLYPYEQEQESIGFPPVQSGELRRPDRVLALEHVDPASLVGRLLRRHRPYFANESAHDPLFRHSEFVRREGIASTAGVPLRIGRTPVGILFANYRRPHPFPSQERSAIRLFASQAAVIIHIARQFEARNSELAHRKALNEGADAITRSLAGDQRSVLAAIVKAAVAVASAHGPPATLGVLQLLDTERNALSFESVYPPEKAADLRRRHGERRSLDKSQAPNGRIGISGRAVLERKEQCVNDATADPDYVTFDENSRSELDVPLFDGDQVIGVLGVESPARDAFSMTDVTTLIQLAAMAATALRVSRQARRLQRTSTVAGMGAWNAQIGHVIQPAVGRIRWAVREALQSPGLSEPLRAKLEEIDNCANTLQGTDIPAERPEPGRALRFNPAEVDRVAGRVVRELEGAYAGVHVEHDLTCPGVHVAMHEQWLSNALSGLIHNAARAIQGAGRDGHVRVRTRQKEKQVQVLVEDDGPGLPPALEKVVLEEPIPKENGHIGRGLLLVRYLVEQYGGEIKLDWNRPGEGVCFAFHLPVFDAAPPGAQGF